MPKQRRRGQSQRWQGARSHLPAVPGTRDRRLNPGRQRGVRAWAGGAGAERRPRTQSPGAELFWGRASVERRASSVQRQPAPDGVTGVRAPLRERGSCRMSERQAAGGRAENAATAATAAATAAVTAKRKSTSKRKTQRARVW
ncbi:hypothetical protein K491DRAFT_714591 [Lophiostoma macrostomum CBS 122681]|uniref:Uncharacterized protein n=1 Tax=Lophiostoma macrostomum CBS 122681 TaxID=1314788 RepID=A0A6A6TBM7_9PLEO|nr:hypothetical protein K491DRAFT_714591 [Lophiostoma macrostomum CBS 122681]